MDPGLIAGPEASPPVRGRVIVMLVDGGEASDLGDLAVSDVDVGCDADGQSQDVCEKSGGCSVPIGQSPGCSTLTPPGCRGFHPCSASRRAEYGKCYYRISDYCHDDNPRYAHEQKDQRPAGARHEVEKPSPHGRGVEGSTLRPF